MLQSPKIVLLLSSFLCLLFSSCAISKYKHLCCDKVVLTEENITPILKKNQALKFKTTIDVLKNHLSGILILKQTDSITKRLVFVTELGMKMFDLEKKDNSEINAVYVFEPMNKPAIISALKENFNNMLLLDAYYTNTGKCINREQKTIYHQKSNKKNKRYYSTTAANNLVLQETFRNKKRTSKITYTYSANTNSYQEIKCKQFGLVKFHFELINISNQND